VRAVPLLRTRRQPVFGEPHHHVADLEMVILYEWAKLGKVWIAQRVASARCVVLQT
jgi:hypothetical protein